MPRYFRIDRLEGDQFFVSGREARHLARVMRLRPGDSVLLCDGNGLFYKGTVTRTSPEEVEGRIERTIPSETEPGTRIVLCQALPKGDKMDEIVRRGTEIGVSEFIPFLSRRCVSLPDAAAGRRRLERWTRIAEEAAKQAGRSVVPVVRPLAMWDDVLRICAERQTVMAWEGERGRGARGVLAGLVPQKPTVLLIGPEGGFDPAETESALQAGAKPVSLGPRILRTETAGPVLAALVLYEFGELEPAGGEGAD